MVTRSASCNGVKYNEGEFKSAAAAQIFSLKHYSADKVNIIVLSKLAFILGSPRVCGLPRMNATSSCMQRTNYLGLE